MQNFFAFIQQHHHNQSQHTENFYFFARWTKRNNLHPWLCSPSDNISSLFLSPLIHNRILFMIVFLLHNWKNFIIVMRFQEAVNLTRIFIRLGKCSWWIWTYLLDVSPISTGPKFQNLPLSGNGFDPSSPYALLPVITSMTISTRSNLAARSSLALGQSWQILPLPVLTPLVWAAGLGSASRVAQVAVSSLCAATGPMKLRKLASISLLPAVLPLGIPRWSHLSPCCLLPRPFCLPCYLADHRQFHHPYAGRRQWWHSQDQPYCFLQCPFPLGGCHLSAPRPPHTCYLPAWIPW